MMSISLAASCLRMANICSCLRMVEAFSTACSSAKARSSVGDLDLRSWSFISRMRGLLRVVRRALRNGQRREGGGEVAGLARKILLPDRVSGSFEPETRIHPPAFQESGQKISDDRDQRKRATYRAGKR